MFSVIFTHSCFNVFIPSAVNIFSMIHFVFILTFFSYFQSIPHYNNILKIFFFSVCVFKVLLNSNDKKYNSVLYISFP